MALVEVCKVSDIKPGKGKTVKANGKQIAVFNVDGKFHAVDNTCLHRGGPLGEGSLSGNTVTCGWHGWQYDVSTGSCKTNPSGKIACFKVKADGDKLMVEV